MSNNKNKMLTLLTCAPQLCMKVEIKDAENKMDKNDCIHNFICKNYSGWMKYVLSWSESRQLICDITCYVMRVWESMYAGMFYSGSRLYLQWVVGWTSFSLLLYLPKCVCCQRYCHHSYVFWYFWIYWVLGHDFSFMFHVLSGKLVTIPTYFHTILILVKQVILNSS